jgi:hypothetical protein
LLVKLRAKSILPIAAGTNLTVICRFTDAQNGIPVPVDGKWPATLGLEIRTSRS